MADTIKIGNLDISAFKVGSDDCKVYLGDTLLYSGGTPPTPPTPTYKWVSYNEGDTVPASLIFYGVKLYLDLGADNEIDFQGTQGGIAFMYVADADGWYGIDIETHSEIDLSSYYDSSEGCYIVLFSDLGYGGLPIMYPPEQFEFDVDLYEEYQPTPPPSTELQWVTFSNGDTIPSDLQIYGIKGTVNDLSDAFTSYEDDIYVEDESHNMYGVHIGGYFGGCYGETGIAHNTSVEYIFSNIGCSDSYTVSSKTIAYMSNDIQLYIYA